MLENVVVMDKNGRVTIPADIRKRLGLKAGQTFAVDCKEESREVVFVPVSIRVE